MSCKATLSRICSFSSEDPNHPAANLLKPDTFRKWKCLEAGEKEAFVIIQLDKVEKILSLDIGNEASAFIEVSVSRSGTSTTNQEFQVIQNQTAFMTVAESKDATCTNRVKMFSNSLVKSIAAEKWDLIKVSCIQPFNRRIQYGLSFINVVIQGDSLQNSSIGGFKVLKSSTISDNGSPDVDDPIRIGSFFAKRMAAVIDAKGGKSPSSTSPSSRLPVSPTAAIRTTSVISSQIRDVTSPSVSLSMKADLSTTVPPKISKVVPPKNGTAKLAQQVPTLSGSGGQSPIGPSKRPVTGNKADAKNKSHVANASPTQRHLSPKTSTKPKPCSSTVAATAAVPSVVSNSKSSSKPKGAAGKPFQKLFEDVAFVLSGFENPYRSTLRRKAAEMGAQCKPDWSPTCTHLICAFVNTPKFRQVKGTRNGKIVTKNWIEDSYRLKRRFPWRRYCLDKSDKGTESEEEIPAVEEEEEEEESTSSENEGLDEGYSLAVDILDSQESGIVVDAKNSHSCGSVRVRDTEENEEGDDNISISCSSTNVKLGNSGTKRRRIARISSSSEDEVDDDEAYDVDTEVDEPESHGHTNDFSEDRRSSESNSNHHHNKCNDFFKSYLFLLHRRHVELEDQTNEIEQIIQKYKGCLTPTFGSEVNFIVTSEKTWIQPFTQLMFQNPNAVIVGESWIQKCAQENKLVDKKSFIITPE